MRQIAFPQVGAETEGAPTRLAKFAWLSIAAAVLTIGLVKVLPRGFIPTDDTGFVFMFTEAAQDISFEEMTRHQQAAAAIVAQAGVFSGSRDNGHWPTGRVTARFRTAQSSGSVHPGPL